MKFLRGISVLLFTCVITAGCTRDVFHLSGGSGLMRGAVVRENGGQTKAAVPSGEENLLASIPLGTMDGVELVLEAFISDMDESFTQSAPRTKVASITNQTIKGFDFYTRVYDSNGGGLYSSDDLDSESPRIAEMSKVLLHYDTPSSQWNFDADYYWPQDGRALSFCSIAPADAIDSSLVSDPILADGKFSFKYSQPLAGADTSDAIRQHDLLVALDAQSAGSDGRVRVNFKHALTGVRFLYGNLRGVKIDAISLTGFSASGVCTLDSSSGEISWTPDEEDTRNFSQTFNVSSSLIDGQSLDDSDNLARTYMMIPQRLQDVASVEIAVAGNIHASKLTLGKLTDSEVGTGNAERIKDWSTYAGKIITFKVKIAENVNSVNVTVEDKCAGARKYDIAVRNDGRSPLFIRATLVGNWTNAKDDILASWNESNPFGTFTSNSGNGFPNLAPDSKWVKGTDGFYYYTRYILPGKTIKENLFDEFTITSKPTDLVGSWKPASGESDDVNMTISNLELAILVQGISAVLDGTWAMDASKFTLANATAAWGSLPFSTILED